MLDEIKLISHLILPLVDIDERFKRDELDNEFMRFVNYCPIERKKIYELLWHTRESFDDFAIPVCDGILCDYPRSDTSVGLQEAEDKAIEEFLHSDFFLDRLQEMFHSQTNMWNESLVGMKITEYKDIEFPTSNQMIVKDVRYAPKYQR